MTTMESIGIQFNQIGKKHILYICLSRNSNPGVYFAANNRAA